MKSVVLIVLLGYTLLTLIYSSNALECYECGGKINITLNPMTGKLMKHDEVCEHPKKTGSKLDLLIVQCPYGTQGCAKIEAKLEVTAPVPYNGTKFQHFTRKCLLPGEPTAGCHPLERKEVEPGLDVTGGEFCGCKEDLCNSGHAQWGSKMSSVFGILIVYVMSGVQ